MLRSTQDSRWRAALLTNARQRVAQARISSQRRLLVLAGEAHWARDEARELLAALGASPVCWVAIDGTGKPASPGGLTMEWCAGTSARGLLGQERDWVVVDAHAGLDPDVLGSVTGIVRGGGLMLLLCPPLAQWPHTPDPAAERIAVYPHTTSDLSGRFLRRLVGLIESDAGLLLAQQGQALPEITSDAALPPPVPPLSFPSPEPFASADQQAAVTAIEQVLTGHRRRPLVLVSDRGRGKSAALGLAAARLLHASNRPEGLHIVVTAPRRDAAAPVFEHARACLPEASYRQGHLRWRNSSIRFEAPDTLCETSLPADLLLVDEAAAIPAPLLQALLARYSRLVFSTTEHGYEGTGRGFAVRFRQTLDRQTPGWRELRLHSPVRWAEDDPLETWLSRALLLDADCAPDAAVQGLVADDVDVEILDRERLVADEADLSALFGLLVVAHYRTSPNDLRNLLDGPGLRIHVMRYRGHIVAAALVAAEGGFDDAMAEAIFTGKRRPRGHLLPQSLVTHMGLKSAAALRCARIMRIAVHPAVQRQGLGRRLLHHIRHDARQRGMDLLGASFGATTGLLQFWRNEYLLPVRVGFRRGHASGEYSVMVLCALSAAAEPVHHAARLRLLTDLPHWLGDPLRELDGGVAAALLVGETTDDIYFPPPDQRAMLESFASGARSYEDSLGPLWRFVVHTLANPATDVPEAQCRLLIARVLQGHGWSQVAALCGERGRAGALARLREAIEGLLSAE
ncbi:MAG: tRNA(Met) cytidine acetyltransferase [Gammaproteobacteria bacterium]|nr:tRNA(Met) cytidine acetyltransferase [Gammaproteobacteria bacterium]